MHNVADPATTVQHMMWLVGTKRYLMHLHNQDDVVTVHMVMYQRLCRSDWSIIDRYIWTDTRRCILEQLHEQSIELRQ